MTSETLQKVIDIFVNENFNSSLSDLLTRTRIYFENLESKKYSDKDVNFGLSESHIEEYKNEHGNVQKLYVSRVGDYKFKIGGSSQDTSYGIYYDVVLFLENELVIKVKYSYSIQQWNYFGYEFEEFHYSKRLSEFLKIVKETINNFDKKNSEEHFKNKRIMEEKKFTFDD